MGAGEHLVHGHLVHGMGTALEAPTWPPITADEAARVLAHYPAVGALRALRWHSPRPFSAACLVDTDAGTLFLKRHPERLRSAADLTVEHGFMAHLQRGGVAVPHVLRDAAGSTALAEAGWTYELHAAAPGSDLYRDRHSWTGFLDPAHANAAGAALARMHRAAQGHAAPARDDRPLVASFTLVPARDPLAALDACVAQHPALADVLDPPRMAALRDLLCRIDPVLSAACAAQAPLWTHNDWHPSNLSWHADGTVAAAFDFGLANRTSALHDLATAFERCAFAWLDLGQGDDAAIGDPDTALALLAGYRSILPLDIAQIACLAALLPVIHIEFALAEIAYFAGIVGDPAQAVQAFDDYLIGHAAWFAGAGGARSLKAFAQGAHV